MIENLEVASSIEHSQEKVYDIYCKKILSNKQILAHIIKECIDEFKDIPTKIIPNYIESNLQNDNLNINNDKIIGKNLEDESIPGSLIKYDILFTPRKLY